jgi:hypothetical protein
VTRNTRIRKRRGTAWTSDSSKRANKARWAADRARRDAEEPGRLRDLAAQHAAHPPITEGSILGAFEYRDHLTGKVRRWVVIRGNRADRIRLRFHDGRTTTDCGWTKALDNLRPHLASLT